jgi:sulfate adenylyltransferase subunit 2
VLLFSGGKDSIVMLHLALKAFRLLVMHVDTGHNRRGDLTRDERSLSPGCLVVARRCRKSTPAGSSRPSHREIR